jgi:glutaredoxin 3
MEIVTYTLPWCNHCKQLKELFRRAEVTYTEVVLHETMTVEEFHNLYPTIDHFPYVVIDNEPVGGLVDTVKLFVDKGLVSSSKKE